MVQTIVSGKKGNYDAISNYGADEVVSSKKTKVYRFIPRQLETDADTRENRGSNRKANVIAEKSFNAIINVYQLQGKTKTGSPRLKGTQAPSAQSNIKQYDTKGKLIKGERKARGNPTGNKVAGDFEPHRENYERQTESEITGNAPTPIEIAERLKHEIKSAKMTSTINQSPEKVLVQKIRTSGVSISTSAKTMENDKRYTGYPIISGNVKKISDVLNNTSQEELRSASPPMIALAKTPTALPTTVYIRNDVASRKSKLGQKSKATRKPTKPTRKVVKRKGGKR